MVCPNCTDIFQDFDEINAPTPPAGWFAENALGPNPLWATSSTAAQTPPNDVFVDDPALKSDKRLETPDIFVTSAAAQVKFGNFYNLEGSPGNYFDGGVLEVSIDGLPFTDIIDAGGSFLANGYNATLSDDFGNPLGGRMAWSGNSAVYNTTLLNLGPNFAGRTVRLRFRMGSDPTVSAPGWRIDNFAISTSDCPPKLLSAVSRKVHGAAGTFDIDLPRTGMPGVECRTGAVAGDYQVVLNFVAPITVGVASVSSGSVNVASSGASSEIVTLNLTGITDTQTITITLSNVTDGVNTGTIVVPMGILVGDPSANGSVNASDVAQTKAQSGQPVTNANFRTDTNVSGTVGASDIALVKANAGHSLP